MRTLTVSRRAAVLWVLLIANLFWPPGQAAAGPGGGGLAPSNTCFVIHLYGDLLGRAPSSPELAAALTFLNLNPNASFALTVANSDEYRTGLIQAWYHTYLGRSASGSDVNIWLNLFHLGHRDEEIQAAILGSPEYFIRAGSTNAGFVTSIFNDLLGRSPGPTELSNWTLFLNTHSRDEMAQAVLGSLEYQARLIQSWFQRYLGRSANNSEITPLEGVISGAGGTDEKALAVLLGSAEYFARAGLCRVYAPLIRR